MNMRKKIAQILIFSALVLFSPAGHAREMPGRGLFVTVIQNPPVLSSRAQIEGLVDFARVRKQEVSNVAICPLIQEAWSLVAIDEVEFYADSQPTITLQLLTANPSSVTMTFSGTPGSDWNLERAASISGPRTNVGSLLINSNSVGLFQDSNPPSTSSFYRARQP